MYQQRRVPVALLLLLFGGRFAFAQAPSYTVNDLGGNSSSLQIHVTGINKSGQVIGYASNATTGQTLAFRSAPNAAPSLPADYIGTLAGSATSCGNNPCSSWALGINASGQVVGYSTTSTGEIHGFRTAAAASINPATDDVGSLGGQPGSDNVLTKAKWINDAGQVVGFSHTSDGSPQAFRTAPNAAINPATDNIEPPPTYGAVYNSEGLSINNPGDTQGDYFASAFLYSSLFLRYHDGTFQTAGGIDAESGYTNINDSDQVIGSEANELGVSQNGVGVQVATCPNVQDCFVQRLNNSLQAVGYRVFHSPSSASYPSFLFMGGTVYDLNTLIPANSGWVLTGGGAINDNGQIITGGTLNGVDHVVRLDPSKPPFTYSMSAASSAISIPQGGSATDNITLTLTSGTPGPVSFTTSPLPNNLTVMFSPTACTPTCTSTMTVSASADAYTGTTPFMVFANSPGYSANILMSVTITTSSGGSGFSWALTAQTQALSVNQGNSVSDLLTATLKSGTPGTITFQTASTLPPGVNVTFSPAACTPDCTTTMTISTSYPTTPTGNYSISVGGTCACSGTGARATVQLQVNAGGDTTAGLVAWWKVSEGSGSTAGDSSGNGNNATLTNPSWWSSDFGTTNLFNGTNAYGSVAESPSLELTNALTIAFWLRPTNNSSEDERVISKLYDWDVKLTSTNHPQFDANGHYAELNYPLFKDTWWHVTFVYDNGTVTGYVNGQRRQFLTNTFGSAADLANWAYGLYLATDPSLSHYYAGSLNDVRVYNRALTDVDVSTVYNSLGNGSTFTFSLSAANPSPRVAQGGSVSDTITATTSRNATYIGVSFEASGLPAGATTQFSPGNCAPTCSTTMTITTSSTTPTGTYNIVVNGTGGGTSANTTVALTVTGPANYSIGVASSNLSVAQGGSVSDNVTLTALSGTQSAITFATSGLPAGATGTFSPGSCTPSCTTTLTIATASTTPTGTYQVGITGTGGGSQAATGVTLTVIGGSGGPDITSGLAAWWKFNEGNGSTAADSSGNGNSASLHNPSWTTSTYGPTNFFSGSGSYGLVNESASLEMTDQLTVAFWVNPSSNPETDPRIISKAYDWEVKLNTSAYRYPQFTARDAYAQLNTALPLNTWSHVVFTFDQGTVTGYVNGAPVSFLANTFTKGTKLLPYGYNLYLGVHNEDLENPFIGDLNDVRVYNRVLTAQDVAALHSYLTGSAQWTFSLTPASSTVTVKQGGSATDTITAKLVSGPASEVSFGTSSLASGVTTTFSPTSCIPDCSTTMTITALSTAPPGTYSIGIVASGGGSTNSTTVTLTVNADTGGADITSGLMAWWKLNDGSGSTAADSSGNGNTATLHNPDWTTSTYGATNSFTGSGSYGQVNESSSLEMTKQLTVAFWVNPSSNPESDPRIISKLYDWDVKLNHTLYHYPQFSAGGAYAQLNVELPLNTWSHVVFTYDNGTVTGYVNGASVSFNGNTFTKGDSLPTYAYNLYLAVHDGGLSNPFIGDLNDVRIYNRPLTAQDVAALYAYLPANH